MFYILSHEYTGPNEVVNVYTVTVQTEPGETNMSHETQIEGYLGTTNDWSLHAHGEFETEDEARTAADALAVKLGGAGSREIDYESEGQGDPIIAVFRVGYEGWGAEASREWCYEGVRADVTADTTDEQIEALIEHYELMLNDEDGTLDTRAVRSMMSEHRDGLREEAI